MNFTKWDESISVGIEEIDEQHQRLFSIIQALINTMKNGHSQNAPINILEELTNYIDFHFKTEERVFQLTDYPGADNHRKEHTYFENKIAKLKSGYENGRIELVEEMITFLKEWARNHIKNEDKKYAEFIVRQKEIFYYKNLSN